MAKEFSYGVCPYIVMMGDIYILLNITSPASPFNFFKGKIEDGETIEDCAIRELYEEIGVKISKDDLEDYFFQSSPRKDIGIFLVDWTKYYREKFKFQPREIYGVYWSTPIKITTSNNQQKIMNDIELFFKPKRYSLMRLAV